MFSKGGGDSLGERNFIIMLSSLDIIMVGDREDDSLFETSFFEDAIDGESFLPEELGDLKN